MKRSRRPEVEQFEGKLLLSAAGVPSPGAVLMVPLTPTQQGLVVRLTTDHRVYREGQPVMMTVKETNVTNHNVVAFWGLFSTTGFNSDGFYVTQGGKTVWPSNAGNPPGLFEAMLPPHQSVTLTATWNGQSNEAPLSSHTGLFQVHSQIPGARPVTIRIVGPGGRA